MNSENPYSVGTAADVTDVAAQKIPFRRFFVAWLSFCLLTFMLTMGISLMMGVLLIVILVSTGAEESTVQAVKPIYTRSCGFILPIPVSLLCYRWSVRRFIVKPSMRA